MDSDPQIIQEPCEITFNALDKANRYRMRLKSETLLPHLKAGQRMHIRVPGMEARPLPRNFPLYDVNADEGTIDVLYYVIGYATGCMTRTVVGQKLLVEGPVGEAWDVPADARRVLLVSEDMGGASLMQLGRELTEAGTEVRMIAAGPTYGAVASFDLYGRAHGFEVEALVHGTTPAVEAVTEAVTRELAAAEYDFVACCAVAEVNDAVTQAAQEAGAAIQCQLDRD